VTASTNPIHSFGPDTPRPPPTITCKKIHSRINTAATPPHETAKNAMATRPARKEGLITREHREGQELDNRMCFHHVTSEPRTHTFTLHARPSPLCAEDYEKLQSLWSCDEPEKVLLSVDIATCLVCARKFICSLASLFIFFFI
jgi:hypothetical protein